MAFTWLQLLHGTATEKEEQILGVFLVNRLLRIIECESLD